MQWLIDFVDAVHLAADLPPMTRYRAAPPSKRHGVRSRYHCRFVPCYDRRCAGSPIPHAAFALRPRFALRGARSCGVDRGLCRDYPYAGLTPGRGGHDRGSTAAYAARHSARSRAIDVCGRAAAGSPGTAQHR